MLAHDNFTSFAVAHEIASQLRNDNRSFSAERLVSAYPPAYRNHGAFGETDLAFLCDRDAAARIHGALSPAGNRYACAFTGRGINTELVDEPPCAPETESQAVARGESVAHGEVKIGNPGAGVNKIRPQPTASSFLDQFENDFAATPVKEHVPS